MIELFSKRQAKLIAPVGEVYVYDKVPDTLRNKVVYILDDALGDANAYGGVSEFDSWGSRPVRQAYEMIWHLFRREHGMPKESCRDYRKSVLKLFSESNDLHALDLIELFFLAIDRLSRDYDYKQSSNADKEATKAIAELNRRFQEENIGYRYESGELIKIDSEFTHEEIIKPALSLLRDPRLIGANDEFLKAHEDYRKGEYKGCVHKACQAFESVMKVICKSNGWEYDPNDTAKKLILVLKNKGLIKSYSENSYNALVTMLESAIPTPRNKEASHGQGDEIRLVSSHLASHILNLTASTMLYLAGAEEELQKSAAGIRAPYLISKT